MIEPYYRDEWCTLYLGDCREVLPQLELADVETVITDPPYGETSLRWDRWPEGWLEALPESVRQLWCFGSMRMFLDQRDEFGGWSYGQEVVWEKHNGSGFATDRFKRVHELVAQWYRGRWDDLTIRPQLTGERSQQHHKRRSETETPHTGSRGQGEGWGLKVTHDEKLQRSVMYVRSMHGRARHPTEKPIGIVEPVLKYSTDRGHTVLDVFAGSGAVLDTARQNGRHAIGIEGDEQYCEVIANRLREAVLPL